MDSVQICDAFNGLGNSAWSSLTGPSAFPSLNVARMVANTVLMPDGAVLVLGGCTGLDYFTAYPNPTVEMRPEIYRRPANAWTLQSPQSSARMYHSTAALLPSGNVVTAGGDVRSKDWEVFTPDYLYLTAQQNRPSFTSIVGPSLAWSTIYQIHYAAMPSGLHVDRVVLMRPCSVTHHSDMDQRYVELVEQPGTPPPNTIVVKTPPQPSTTATTQGSVVTPSGWYMMFLISNTGKPSIAQWVHLP